MSKTFTVVSPIDGQVVQTREYASSTEIQLAVSAAKQAQREWRLTSLKERKRIVSKAIDWLVEQREQAAEAITESMGRPIQQSAGEIQGVVERASYMLNVAKDALADIVPAEKEGFIRFLRREPVGVVLVVAPWNFPFLTAVNSIVPSLVAGNAVLLKHSSQTPAVADLFQAAFDAAELPPGVFQALTLTHEDADTLMRSDGVDFVAFTGSVQGGKQVQQALSQRFIGAGLELGGKDAAYVRADSDVKIAAAGLVDGAFFNSGQSCCGIERIYVHEAVYDDFVEEFVRLTYTYQLDNPREPTTTLGPMVRASAAEFVRGQIAEAVEQGAKTLIDESKFPKNKIGTAYLAPQVLVDVTHEMRIMTEESFGPVVGIVKVEGDDEAVKLINDSDFGLTASIWTADEEKAESLAAEIEVGTVFMNRCDYLDPALAWTGVKDTGHGISLSTLGYAQLTRVKSYHLKVN